MKLRRVRPYSRANSTMAAAGSPGTAVSLDLEVYDTRRAAMLVLLKVAGGVTPFAPWIPVGEAIARSKSEKLDFYMQVLYELLRDLLALQHGSGEIRNQDIRKDLDALAGRVSFEWVRAAVKQVEVDKRSNPADKRIELDDTAVMNLLQKEIKNRRESLEEARKANRPDLIEANEAEINVLQAFLPKAMPSEELRAMVQDAINETGAASPADMGKVMKIIMAKVAGRAPNDMVSATVREHLQK